MHHLTAAIAAAIVTVGAGSAAVHADGNSDAAGACQKGGYLTLVREDGTTFRNVGDCVSYAAGGGVLRPANATAVLSGIVLSADNALAVGYELGGVMHQVGSKPGIRATVQLDDVTIGPFATGTPLRVYLTDQTCGVTYFSDGDHARVVGDNPYEIDIADGGPGCAIATSPWAGATEGNLSLVLTVN